MSEAKISVGKIAQLLRVSPSTVRNWDKSGKIESYKTPGGHRRYILNEVLEKLSKHENKGKEMDGNKILFVTKSIVTKKKLKKIKDKLREDKCYIEVFNGDFVECMRKLLNEDSISKVIVSLSAAKTILEKYIVFVNICNLQNIEIFLTGHDYRKFVMIDKTQTYETLEDFKRLLI